MENQENYNKKIAYQKAEKRVKEIRTYYYIVIGFLIASYFIVRKNYSGNIFDIARNYSVWMVISWAIFILGYGIYLFVPYFHKWEEKKINELMNKNNNF